MAKTWDFMPQQKEYLDLTEKVNRHLCAYDTGTGKTLIQLALIDRMKKRNGRQTLVVMPIGVVESWLEQAQEFYPELRLLPVVSYKKIGFYRELAMKWGMDHRGKKEVVQGRLKAHCDALIINPEVVKKYHMMFRGWNVIVDESDMLRNYKPKARPMSNFVAFAMSNFKDAEFCYFFSATPANNVFQIYAQAEILEPGIFGKWSHFQRKYGLVDEAATRGLYKKTGRNITIYKAAPEAWGEVKAKLEHLIAYKDKAEVLKDLPPLVDQVWTIPPVSGLPVEYRFDLKKAKNAHEIAPGGFVEEVIRYQQLASGFLYPAKDEETGEEIGETERFKHGKIKALHDVLKKHPGEKVIIWINFIEEVDQILRDLGRVNCAVCANHKIAKGKVWELDFFKSKAQYLIAHPMSIGRGVDGLQKICHVQIVYSPQYEYGKDHQMLSRLHRNKQRFQTFVYRFSTQQSIEPSILKAVKQKRDFTDFLLGRE